MSLRETFGNYRPDFDVPINELEAKEILRQFKYLASGLADEKDARKGVSLGLPGKLAARYNELQKHIEEALEHSFA